MNIKKFDEMCDSYSFIYVYETCCKNILYNTFLNTSILLLTVCGNRSAGDQRDSRCLDGIKCRTRCSIAFDLHIGSESNLPANPHKPTLTILIAECLSRTELTLFREW